MLQGSKMMNESINKMWTNGQNDSDRLLLLYMLLLLFRVVFGVVLKHLKSPFIKTTH